MPFENRLTEMKRLPLVISVALSLAVPLGAQERVDLLLHGGKIFSADEQLSIYSAVAVLDGRIVALGGPDELHSRYQAVRTVDLDGKLVVPGFIDTHIHISGDPARWVDLSGLRDLAELKARITRKAEQLGSGEWITGYGWSEDELTEQRRPLRSTVCPTRRPGICRTNLRRQARIPRKGPPY